MFRLPLSEDTTHAPPLLPSQGDQLLQTCSSLCSDCHYQKIQMHLDKIPMSRSCHIDEQYYRLVEDLFLQNCVQ